MRYRCIDEITLELVENLESESREKQKLQFGWQLIDKSEFHLTGQDRRGLIKRENCYNLCDDLHDDRARVINLLIGSINLFVSI